MEKIIIIGGGTAGYTAAIRGSQLGMDITLIEQDKLGGTCLNRGCIPTKAILHASSLFYKMQKNDAGIKADEITINIDTVFENKDKIVNKLVSGIEKLITANQIKYFNAEAKIIDKNHVELSSGEKIFADKIILATGSSVILPPIKGIENALSSTEVLSQKFQKYENVTIIGGGVIGIELASFFSELGSKVTIIDCLDTILSTTSIDISKYVSLSLRKKGVKFILNSTVKEIKNAGRVFQTTYIEKEKENIIESDMVVCCVGRKSNSILGIQKTRVIFNHGFEVDSFGKTAEENIYAIGDCAKGSIQLAHYASANGIRTIEYIFGKHTKSLNNVPSCIYTNPNAALVGKKENQYNYEEIEVGKFNIGANGKSLIEGNNIGFVKVIFEKTSEKLVGAELVCDNACEMIGFVGNLINNEAKREEILSSIYPHPSVSEGFFEAVEDSKNSSIHTIYKR